MKNMFKNTIKTLIVVLLLTGSASIYAQTGFGDDVDDVGGAGVPLDGGLSLLVAGAVAYGIKKLRDKRSE